MIVSERRQPRDLAATIALASHPDPGVRLSITSSLPDVGVDHWVGADDIVVAALMMLTTDVNPRMLGRIRDPDSSERLHDQEVDP